MAKKEEGKPVMARDRVQVEWTKSPHHKAGTTSMVHPEAAAKLKEKGFAKIVGTPEKGARQNDPKDI